jgi:hypothetical protein
LGCGGGLCLAGDVEDVEFATGGGLGGVVFGGVVRDVVAVDDVIVPVSLALLQRIPLELEASQPPAALLGILGERKLSCIVIPRTEEMHGLAPGRCA